MLTTPELKVLKQHVLSLIVSNNRTDLIGPLDELFSLVETFNPWTNLTDSWFNTNENK